MKTKIPKNKLIALANLKLEITRNVKKAATPLEKKIFTEKYQSSDKPYCFFMKNRLIIKLGSPAIKVVIIRPINSN